MIDTINQMLIEVVIAITMQKNRRTEQLSVIINGNLIPELLIQILYSFYIIGNQKQSLLFSVVLYYIYYVLSI